MELRRAQHGLSEDGQEAQGLHEQRRVQEEVGDVGRHQREGQHALHVVGEVAPRPEMVPVKVWKVHNKGKARHEPTGVDFFLFYTATKGGE